MPIVLELVYYSYYIIYHRATFQPSSNNSGSKLIIHCRIKTNTVPKLKEHS